MNENEVLFDSHENEHGFLERLQFSRGVREASDIETLKRIIPGCISVKKTTTEQDKEGVDYIATLRRGTEIYIDAKTREKNASRWWKHGEPELACEIWSVMPGGKFNTPKEHAITGWTLSESKKTDLILYTFDESDCQECFIIGFQHLRMAFIQHFAEWKKRFKVKNQTSYNGSIKWESSAVFVPVSHVLNAICEVSRQVTNAAV